MQGYPSWRGCGCPAFSGEGDAVEMAINQMQGSRCRDILDGGAGFRLHRGQRPGDGDQPDAGWQMQGYPTVGGSSSALLGVAGGCGWWKGLGGVGVGGWDTRV